MGTGSLYDSFQSNFPPPISCGIWNNVDPTSSSFYTSPDWVEVHEMLWHVSYHDNQHSCYLSWIGWLHRAGDPAVIYWYVQCYEIPGVQFRTLRLRARLRVRYHYLTFSYHRLITVLDTATTPRIKLYLSCMVWSEKLMRYVAVRSDLNTCRI